MTSGRYTAYHIYQGLSFPEAQKAATRPYKLPEYKCRHSQRGYLFQFDNMVERTHFDAANTSCCNEPVRNFENKPQYVESFKPMKPKDCKSMAQAFGCTILEVSVESSSAICASAGAKVRRIKILCPAMCSEFAGLQGGGSFRGQYGTFRSLGMEAGDIMIMDYTPDPELIDGWYDNCSGTRRLTEEFCGGYHISFSLNAGLNYPGGCGCDCCGENGSFPPPFMTLTHSVLTNDWSNTINVAGYTVYGEGCSGGQITGTFSGTGRDYVDAVISRTSEFRKSGLPIIATRDYHPGNHISFFTSHPGTKPLDVIQTHSGEQVLWPPHCVQGTPGAEILLPPDLITEVVSTGDQPDAESYSGFRDDLGRDTGLKGLLEELGVKDLIIYGLATDYCVQATVMHAREEGYGVTFIKSLSRGITPEGTDAALEEMKAAGVTIED